MSDRANGRKCSHVARVHANNKRPAPQPEDSSEPRRQQPWQPHRSSNQQNDGLQLNPPKLRPLTKQQQQQQHNDSLILDWRSFRAKLVQMEQRGLLNSSTNLSPKPAAAARGSGLGPFAFSSGSWAHELPGPEVGCVLVARQEGMQFFDRTVVLLAAHDVRHGSVGFVLNKPSPLRLSEVQLSATAQGILDTFGSQRLQLGGPVHMETLTLLHAFAGLSGAQKVSEGVYYGGLPAAVDLVRSGLAKPEDFKLLLGMTGWSAGQLEQEIAAGAWWVVAAGPGLVLPSSNSSSGSGSDARSNKQQLLKGRAPDALWRHVLQLIGRPAQVNRAGHH